MVSFFPKRDAISKSEGPIPNPVNASLKAGSSLPIPKSLSSKYYLNSISIFTELKSEIFSNLIFNSDKSLGVSSFHFFLIVFSS